jgi:hypothetical protein
MVALDICDVKYFVGTVRMGCAKIRACELECIGRILKTVGLGRGAQPK